MEPPLYIFFPSSENIKMFRNIIKDQGKDVCRQKIDQDWINENLHELSFGICYMTPIAQMDRRSIKKNSDKFRVHGFVLCRIDKNAPMFANIDLVCSRETSKTGKLLMELAEEHIRTNNPGHKIKFIELEPLSDLGLKRWYEKLGYIPKKAHMGKAFIMFKEV